jgi:hypothetical protein
VTSPGARLVSSAVPTWPVAGGSLVVGFLVAEMTGVRALGGVVLLVALVWCWVAWARRRSVLVAVGLTAVYVAAFALSHVIAGAIGALVSVALVSAAVALVVFAVADRPVLVAAAGRGGDGGASRGAGGQYDRR